MLCVCSNVKPSFHRRTSCCTDMGSIGGGGGAIAGRFPAAVIAEKQNASTYVSQFKNTLPFNRTTGPDVTTRWLPHLNPASQCNREFYPVDFLSQLGLSRPSFDPVRRPDLCIDEQQSRRINNLILGEDGNGSNNCGSSEEKRPFHRVRKNFEFSVPDSAVPICDTSTWLTLPGRHSTSSRNCRWTKPRKWRHRTSLKSTRYSRK